jgi:DNA repair protein RecO (recombination protein O)
MQEVFDAIILRSRNYSDSSIIIKCYSKQKGVVSLIARGVKKKKKNHVMGLFQPLSLVEIVSYSKSATSNLKNLKEIKSNFFYKNLQFEPIKLGLTMFLAEMLDLTLQEEEPNVLLFEFLESSFHYLDELEEYANFHISFLIELTKHLGFYPRLDNINSTYFDLEHGIFYDFDKNTPYLFSGEVIENFKKFLGTKFVETNDIVLNRNQRNLLLKLVIHYYSLHISGFRDPRSLDVLISLYN